MILVFNKLSPIYGICANRAVSWGWGAPSATKIMKKGQEFIKMGELLPVE